ncbi:MAG: helix-turn-helix domain-containing protein [Cytophagales bacterium]|jgi:transcriptional regulator GlxA family with amidase domain|nr:helix-turn-helix domain-containing protein [Cytophagales bacterium]
MKHISILVPHGAILSSVEGPRQLFAQVNQFYKAQGAPPLFEIQLVGLAKEILLSGGLYTIHADLLLPEVERTDLVVIPAVDGEIENALSLNRDMVAWIGKQYRNGAEVASLCKGAFLLASTGLLAGRKCATHWMAAREFMQLFPDVQLVTEKIITDENGLYSSGGAFSYLNLILHLIEKYAGRDMAVLSAKVFAIEIGRNSQLSFAIFQGQKGHADESVKKAQEYIESNYQDKITVEQLTSMLSLSRRSFERRFKKATANTVVEYVQRVKIEAAKKSFETSRKNINEVMYDVGYSDTKAFRSLFKKITGIAPVEYRNKYNKQATVE